MWKSNFLKILYKEKKKSKINYKSNIKLIIFFKMIVMKKYQNIK